MSNILYIILSLSFFTAIITFIMWIISKLRKKQSAAKLKRILLISTSTFFICTILGAIFIPSSELKPPKDKAKLKPSKNKADIVGKTIDKRMPEIKPKPDPFVKKLISFGFTKKEAFKNAKILKKCGIPTIDVCKPISNESINKLVVFRGVIDDKRTIWFTVEKRKIFYVALNGKDLYDEDKGGYLKKFDEVHIPKTDISTEVADKLRDKTEATLDNYFSNTRYYDAWGYARKDNHYMIQCQATDGSIFTSNWIYCRVWFKHQGNGKFVVTGVQINGKQYKLK